MHKQQSRGELSRHTWHRQESDESSESVNEDMEAARNFPRSSTFPSATNSHQQGAAHHSGSQRRIDGTSGTRNDQIPGTKTRPIHSLYMSDNLCLPQILFLEASESRGHLVCLWAAGLRRINQAGIMTQCPRRGLRMIYRHTSIRFNHRL